MTAAGAELVDGIWQLRGAAHPHQARRPRRGRAPRHRRPRARGAGAGRLRGRHHLRAVRAGRAEGLLHRPGTPSSGTSTRRAGAAARRSATTSATSTPSTRPGWATCPAGARRASGSTRTPSSTSWARRLYRGEFDSREERDEIYRTMTAAGLDESIRVWLATVDNSFPVVDELEGLTRDLVAGPRNPWALREAYVPGSDDVRVGHQWVWTERTTYNPVGGFGDVYSVDLWRNLSDPPIWNDPFTGIPQPFRADLRGGDGRTGRHAGGARRRADLGRRVQGLGARGARARTAVSKVTFDYSAVHRAATGTTASPSPWPTPSTPSRRPSTAPMTRRRPRSRRPWRPPSRPSWRPSRATASPTTTTSRSTSTTGTSTRTTSRAYASPGQLRHALGGQGRHGRPRLRAAPRGLQRHGRQPLQRALAEPRAGRATPASWTARCATWSATRSCRPASSSSATARS